MYCDLNNIEKLYQLVVENKYKNPILTYVFDKDIKGSNAVNFELVFQHVGRVELMIISTKYFPKVFTDEQMLLRAIGYTLHNIAWTFADHDVSENNVEAVKAFLKLYRDSNKLENLPAPTPMIEADLNTLVQTMIKDVEVNLNEFSGNF